MSVSPRPAMDRFMEKVDKSATCWLWTAAKANSGYGAFFDGQHLTKAHRWLYEQVVGPVPDGLELDHLCRTPACVNPAHLEPVTHRENILRGNTFAARHAASTHCPQGHAYEGANLRFTTQGHRRCGTCVDAWQAAHNERRRHERRVAS